MFVSHRREKLLNAIIYFVKNTKYCHTLKLFKLLYFLDFEHFRQTGQSVTGLRYVAWPMGPAPDQLWHELDAPPGDLAKAISVVKSTPSNKGGLDAQREVERQSWQWRDEPTWLDKKQFATNREATWFGPPRREIKAKAVFDARFFTKREMRIMKWLAEVFHDTLADGMTDVSHMRNMPWEKVYEGGKGRGLPIDYELSLKSQPLITDERTISEEEYLHRKEAFKEIENHTT